VLRDMNSISTDKTDLLDLSKSEISKLFSGWGFSNFYTTQLWTNLYIELARNFHELSNLKPEILAVLRQHTKLTPLKQVKAVSSGDGLTKKYLLQLEDGLLIETVLMRFRERETVCISTQVGCAMGCIFCATGQMGFQRHLSTGEIVSQFIHVARAYDPKEERPRNIVLMGMGEPFHNFGATVKALDIFMDPRGLSIGPRYITVSTVGIPKAIRRFADKRIPINLAVSLHAATDRERDALIPVNRKWNLGELMQSCRYYSKVSSRRIFFEYALIASKNDTTAQAHSLGRLLSGIDAHVNLIPLNTTEGYGGRPSSEDSVISYQKVLAEYDIPSTVRQKRGLDISAGCGQLYARYLDKKSHSAK